MNKVAMKSLRTIALIGLTFISSSAVLDKKHDFSKKDTTYVWICVTENSYAYHYNHDCRGMKQCKGEKRKVTLQEAKGKYNRKLCGWED